MPGEPAIVIARSAAAFAHRVDDGKEPTSNSVMRRLSWCTVTKGVLARDRRSRSGGVRRGGNHPEGRRGWRSSLRDDLLMLGFPYQVRGGQIADQNNAL